MRGEMSALGVGLIGCGSGWCMLWKSASPRLRLYVQTP
jgi:hypothetical protein